MAENTATPQASRRQHMLSNAAIVNRYASSDWSAANCFPRDVPFASYLE